MILRFGILALFIFTSFLGDVAYAKPRKSKKDSKVLESELAEDFKSVTDSFDYVKRSVMIPMRDGVKLNTIILMPKKAKNAPILLTRTPYNAKRRSGGSESAHLSSVLRDYADLIVDGGYIRVFQDIRGKYDSEGDYVMLRPFIGPLNPTNVDHSTDTYDTIEWLIKNLPESNGKVGIIGPSYDGFLALAALVNPHPALKVAVPVNPMVDGWIGDDWFHNGAFRQVMLPYVLVQGATRSGDAKWFTTHFDEYDMFLQAGTAGELARQRGLEQAGFWRKVSAHPAYDSFWQEQAVDKILAKQPLTVPTMIVHSLWDQEDIYGAIAAYEAMEALDVNNDKVYLVLGPWNHGGSARDGTHLGAIKFKSDTALHYRSEILAPFLERYLKDDAWTDRIPPVFAYETGSNHWRRLQSWPSGCADKCSIVPTPIHLTANEKITFSEPSSVVVGFSEYVSDPAKPVPYRARPIRPLGNDEAKGLSWPRWLVDDQREASGRTDVLTFTSDVLTAPIKISGKPKVRLVASTSGTDSDWVVKLIDVYPDEVGGSQESMGGYQLMVAGDIFRGRYREGFEMARPLSPNIPLPYQFALPTANHVFLPGHRIMVQVQSSWFPLYDRNPQTFVPSIFWAKSDDFKKAVQRIYYGSGQDSYIELPVVNINAK